MDAELINYLENLVITVSEKEKRKNTPLRGKTKKLVKLTNYLKALGKQNTNRVSPKESKK